MAQPDMASAWLGDALLRDQGLLSRVLATAPYPASGTRLWREPSPQSEAAMQRYGARLLDALERPLPLSSGTVNELSPRHLVLEPGARKAWTGFADHIELRIGPNGELEPVRGLANKLAEHAARIGGVLALVRDPDAGEVSARDIEAGIELAQFYAGEALRLEGASRASSTLLEAQRLVDWLLGSWAGPAVSLPDIYQRGPGSIRCKARASELVAVLEGHGWLVAIPGGAVISGQLRREAWCIVRG